MSRWSALLPREHGAYGQMAFPLVAAFAVAGVSTAAVGLSVAVIAGFLAHEPAAILLGLRGSRAKRELGAFAARGLCVCAAIAAAAVLTAAIVMNPAVRWSLAVPAIPAAVLATALCAGREKTWYGEAAAALAFAGVAIPLTMAAGASVDVALAVAIPFALLFTTTTLAVRVVILRGRGGGDPRATAATQRATLTICAAAFALMAILTWAGWLEPPVMAAAAPGLLTAAVVAARPPAAARLRLLGWSLVAVSTLTALIVVATA
jgi:hypothetical protein